MDSHSSQSVSQKHSRNARIFCLDNAGTVHTLQKPENFESGFPAATIEAESLPHKKTNLLADNGSRPSWPAGVIHLSTATSAAPASTAAATTTAATTAAATAAASTTASTAAATTTDP
jgi:hypothetical protein